MKVVAFNGSPKKEGNTYHAIRMVTKELEKEGIEVEIIHVGNKIIRGCLACNACARNQNGKCIIDNDEVNEWIQKMKECRWYNTRFSSSLFSYRRNYEIIFR